MTIPVCKNKPKVTHITIYLNLQIIEQLYPKVSGNKIQRDDFIPGTHTNFSQRPGEFCMVNEEGYNVVSEARTWFCWNQHHILLQKGIQKLHFIEFQALHTSISWKFNQLYVLFQFLKRTMILQYQFWWFIISIVITMIHPEEAILYIIPQKKCLPKINSFQNLRDSLTVILTILKLHVCFNSYSASHDNWCTATLWNRIMTVQCEGMGEVGSARYEPALLPPCPSIRALSYSNCQRSTYSNIRAWQCKC